MGGQPFIRRLVAERPSSYWFALFLFWNLLSHLSLNQSPVTALWEFTWQVLPYFILCAYVIFWLRERDVSPGGRHLAAMLMLLGNSGAMLFRAAPGPGLASVFLLGLMLGWVRRWPALVGFCFGMAALCCPGLFWMAFPLVVLLIVQRDQISLGDLGLFFFGVAPAAVGWFWTRPLAALKFVSPVPQLAHLSGVLGDNLWLIPLALALVLLWRQHAPWADPNARFRINLASLSFGGLILIGLSTGMFVGSPEATAVLLPLFGPVVALTYDRLFPGLQGALWMGVGISALRNVFSLFSLSGSPDWGKAAILGAGACAILMVLSRHWRRQRMLKEL